MVKRVLLIVMCLLAFIPNCHSQIQHGYVKTSGRPNKPSVPLHNVMLRVRGGHNAVFSNKEGKFSLLMLGKKNGEAFMLQDIFKEGFELCNPEMKDEELVFSTTVPIEIAMISSEYLAEIKHQIEEKSYQRAEQNYRIKEKQLKKQLEQQKISEYIYQQKLLELQNQYENYQSLIERLADHYARTDYDHLDSIDIVINECIEKGELENADSLIHTAFDPNTVLERNRDAKAAIHKKMQFAQDIINRATAELEAIRRDSSYAKRVIILSNKLSDEYILQNKLKEAKQCLQVAFSISTLLYGKESERTKIIEYKIAELK